VILGSAWFVLRHSPVRKLFEEETTDQTPEFTLLDEATQRAFVLGLRDNDPGIGLAILNGLFPYVMGHTGAGGMDSRVRELRLQMLLKGARMIVSRGRFAYIPNAQRVLNEAHPLLEQVAAGEMPAKERISWKMEATAVRDMWGELALADHNPEEAIRLHQQGAFPGF
jgi:hypothetical protein